MMSNARKLGAKRSAQGLLCETAQLRDVFATEPPYISRRMNVGAIRAWVANMPQLDDEPIVHKASRDDLVFKRKDDALVDSRGGGKE